MTVLLLLGVMLMGAAIFSLAVAFDALPAKTTDIKARARLRGAETVQLAESIVARTAREATEAARRPWVREQDLQKLQQNLALAGRSNDLLPKLVMAKLAAPCTVALLGFSVAASRGGLGWLLWLIAIVAAYQMPDIWARSRAQEHQSQLAYDLPDLLDQITIALDAGMSFEAAFTRVGTRHDGPLGPQIARTVQDMTVGVPRREAYTALAERNDSEDLTKFVKSLVQAEEFGVPIANVVRLQAEEMRDKRRQRASAAARVVPTKLLFPMLSCLFPVLFIVILTPAVLSLKESL